VYTKFVEVGRVVLINYGADINKVAVIAEIVDHNRVIIDGPCSGVKRQVISLRRVSLTKLMLELPRGARCGVVKKVWEAQGMCAKWSATGTAKKIAQRTIRRNLTDFDRFKVMVAQKKVTRALNFMCANCFVEVPHC